MQTKIKAFTVKMLFLQSNLLDQSRLHGGFFLWHKPVEFVKHAKQQNTRYAGGGISGLTNKTILTN